MSKKKETDQQLDLQKKREEPKKGKVISEEVPEDTTLKDSKTGQMGSLRYEEEVENQLTPNLHWGNQTKSDVSPKDLLKKMSKKKETDWHLKDLQKKMKNSKA